MKVFTDRERLDFLERDCSGDPLVLHNLDSDELKKRAKLGFRGLGLACTGRSLREALDQIMSAVGERPSLEACELERLRKFQRDTEEAEALCCPEDVGFAEWIGILTKRLEAAQESLRDVLKVAQVNAVGAGVDNDKRPSDYKQGLVKAYDHVAEYVQAKFTAIAAIQKAKS